MTGVMKSRTLENEIHNNILQYYLLFISTLLVFCVTDESYYYFSSRNSFELLLNLFCREFRPILGKKKVDENKKCLKEISK